MTLLRLASISNYFCKIENELVVNLKPGKTESVSNATGKLESKQKASEIWIQISNNCFYTTTAEYKYFGTILDQTLSCR